MLIEVLEGVKLRPATPYMLRNDGELLECGDVHPYIWQSHISIDASLENMILHPQNLKWFYDHTKDDSIKELIEIVINSNDNFNKDGYNITDKTYKAKSRDEVLEFLEEIVNATNQEFLRLRMSSMLYGGTSNSLYARISSVHFDWYPLLWDVVNSNNVSDITVVKDQNTFGGRPVAYKIKGQPVAEMPKDEFLTVSGNPVLEMYMSDLSIVNHANKLLNEGKSYRKAYSDVRPRYANGFFKSDLEEGAIFFDIENLLASSKH